MKKPASSVEVSPVLTSIQRRTVLKAAGAGIATGLLGMPAFAQNKPLRIGVIAPRGGVAGTIGECGLRGVEWTTARINAAGGIGGRKVELVIQEETSPKDTIDRFRKLVLQEKVDCVQGIVCLLYTSPSPRDQRGSRMPSSA